MAEWRSEGLTVERAMSRSAALLRWRGGRWAADRHNRASGLGHS